MMMLSKYKWRIVTMLVVFLTLSAALALAGRRTSKTESFKVKKGGELVVRAENVGADIEIRVWTRSEVKVEVDGIPEEDIEDLEISASGNTVHVDYYGRRGWHRSGHILISVDVPPEFSLDLQTSGGDIEVNDRLSGTVKAATAGGDIEIDQVDGEVSLRTSGGDITARDVLGNAEFQTSGGDIDVGDVKGKLSAHTSGGDITVGAVENDLDAKTAGGDIEVGDVGGYADVSTAGGDVRLGEVSGTADLRTAGGDIELLSASGRVTARTAGGDIVLENISGSIEAETAGGDIVVQLVPAGNRDSRFETAGGDIELYLPEKAKANILAKIRIHGGWGWDDDEEGDFDVYSDFKAAKHERNRRGVLAEYVLNGGGANISLKTTNGDIEIRRLSGRY
ncbi:MAG: DUF4097 domain-containing protein [Candidatus Krumholzibacteriia bacterium]